MTLTTGERRFYQREHYWLIVILWIAAGYEVSLERSDELPTCPYCLEPKGLADSHIIPWGIWRLKDTDSGFLEISTESHLPPKKLRKGWYEKLLCEDCDKEIGRNFDNYGRDFFASAPTWKVHELGPGGPDNSFSEIIDYNYATLKLFILSVLWRASLSTTQVGSAVKLLPEQEQRIRQMLRENDPGDLCEFSCAIFKYYDDGRDLHQTVVAPRLFKASNCVRYAEIQFNEFACRIKASNQKDRARYDQVWLSPNGPLRIIHTSPAGKIAFGAKAVQGQHARYNAFRKSR